MDLRLYLRVVSRFRYLVIAGLVLAVALAFLAMFRVGPNGISYRSQKTFRASETLLITSNDPNADPNAGGAVAPLYAQFANSGIVRALIVEGEPVQGSYVAFPIVNGSATLPILEIDATGPTGPGASMLATRASKALGAYLAKWQQQKQIPEVRRNQLQRLSAPRAVVAKGRSLTVPIVVFLGVLVVTLGIAFILENLKPRPPASPIRELEPAPELADNENENGGVATRRTGEAVERRV
jgi:hypothetical protein